MSEVEDTGTCPRCSSICRDKTAWKDHMLSQHNILAFTCDICPKAFFNEDAFIQHFDNEHKSEFNRHVCNFCGVSYKWFKFLNKHIKDKHQIEKLMECSECGEEFYNSVAFRKHLRLKHNGAWNFYKCQRCHRSFTAKDLVVLHDKCDHGRQGHKYFKEYALSHLPNLEDEGLLENSKKCLKCNLEYTSSVYLLKHFKTAHSKQKYFQCCKCEEALYNTRAGLSVHLYYEHGVPREHKCNKCRYGHTKTFVNKIKRNKENKSERVEKEMPEWASRFIKKELPNDIDLVGATETEINNLRSNIKNLFHVLSTVPPSKLRGNTVVDPYLQFYSARKKLSDDLRRDCRRRDEKTKMANGHAIDNNRRQREYECDECHSRFGKRKEIIEHLKEHKAIKSEDTLNGVEYDLVESKVEQKYKCDLCKSMFADELLLLNHLTECHSTEEITNNDTQAVYKCIKCGDGFRDEITFDEHMKAHSTNNCEVCNKSFKDKKGLRLHKLRSHKEKFQCDKCKTEFSNARELSKHSCGYTNGSSKDDDDSTSPQQLDKENKQINHRLKRPKKVPETRRLYKCLKCENRFSNRMNLLSHIQKVHRVNVSKVFKCDKCTAVFRLEDKLKQHIGLKHATPKPLPVIKIKKNKLSPVTLQNAGKIDIINNLIHSSLIKTMHNCKICFSYFPSKELLQRHIQWEHTKNVNLHKCGQCGQVLYSVEDLEMHMNSAHCIDTIVKWKKQITNNYVQQTDVCETL